jgi:NhaP-type Na+/H+ or K+/H+ antiporter
MLLHITEAIKIPYTPIVFLVGIIIGASGSTSDAKMDELFLSLDPDFLLLIFLPALIYESASSVDYHTFKRQAGKIMIMAVPMLVCATYLTAVVMFYILNYGAIKQEEVFPIEESEDVVAEHRLLSREESESIPEIVTPTSIIPWSACVLFGAVISATDPVAVVGLLKQLGAPKSIGTLIEGESLLNDGTAVVIFFVALDFVKGETLTIGEIIAKFCRLSFGGPALGIAFGMVLEFWLAFIHNKPKLETNLTFCFAYITFYVAELPSVHVSGILAIVFLGLYMTRSGKNFISAESEHAVHNFWGQVGFIAETLIFVLSGLMMGGAIHAGKFEAAEIGKTIALYVFLFIIRQGLLVVFYPLMRLTGYPIELKHTILLAWGALRGALGMFLSLVLVNSPDIDKKISYTILFHTSCIALLTLLVNGLTTGCLVRKLGLSKETQI